MSEIIIKLKGGTGNQLFQAAAAASLAAIYEKSCRFSKDNIYKDKYNRKLEISSLLSKLEVLENLKKENINSLFLDEYDIDHPIYFSKSSPLAKLENDIHLEGYFTNYRIHNKNVLKKIKTHIKGLHINPKFKKNNYIAIHTRELHGNVANQLIYSIDNLNIDYYSKCLNKVAKNKFLSKIKYAIVFSDLWKNPENSKLIPKIKALLKRNGIKYITGDNEINSSLEIINIFSYAKCCIISNSTLSWWGAYLSNGKIFSPVMNLWEPNLKVPDNWNQIYANEIAPKTHHRKLRFKTLSLNNKVISNKVYSLKRLKVIKFTRFITTKLCSLKIFIKFKRWLNCKGILSENSYRTFF